MSGKLPRALRLRCAKAGRQAMRDPKLRAACAAAGRAAMQDRKLRAKAIAGSRLSAHRRWHVARGIVKPDCSLCRKETRARAGAR
ncbi:MAG: hypothetical protein ACREM2_08125 [Vulcanimicrobiaceae bacterium]